MEQPVLIMPLPPWVNPPNFLGAIQAGTQAGISLRNSAIAEAAQQQRAQEAAAQLAFHYTQLQAQNERAAAQVQAEQERAMAANLLRAQQANAMERYRQSQQQYNQDRLEIDRSRLGLDRGRLALEAMKADMPKPNENERTLQNFKTAQQELQSAIARHMALPEGPQKEAAQKLVADAQQNLNFWDAKAKGTSANITLPDGQSAADSLSAGATIPTASAGVTGNIESGVKKTGLDTKVSMKMAQYENAMELVKQLEDNLDTLGWSSVGIPGNIAETIGSVAPTVLGKNTRFFKPGVQTFRDKMRRLAESVAREIPEGGRETESQRLATLASLPSTKWITSVPKIREQLAGTRQMLMERARNYAAEVGRVPLVAMDRKQIESDLLAQYHDLKKREQMGLITPDQAKRMADKAKQEHEDAISRFISSGVKAR